MLTEDGGNREILSKCNICYTYPCRNGGTCELKGFREYKCRCTPGFHGDLCQEEIDACFGDPCLNGGECTVLDKFGRIRYVLITTHK